MNTGYSLWHFKAGDRVKRMTGTFKGRVGTVSHIDGQFVVVDWDNGPFHWESFPYYLIPIDDDEPYEVDC